MDMDEYIASGIIESYVLGLATEPERTEFEERAGAFPALKQMVSDFEERLEEYALKEAPPKGLCQRSKRIIWYDYGRIGDCRDHCHQLLFLQRRQRFSGKNKAQDEPDRLS